MTETLNAIRESIDSGEVLTIVYHGGSQPGAYREIAPISTDGQVVRARCYMSNRVKSFKLEKIQLVSHAPAGEQWNAQAARPSRPTYTNLSDVLGINRDHLTALGWHIQETHNSIWLIRNFKNGKPRKKATVMLTYSEMTMDAHYDPDLNWIQTSRKSTRPWHVASRNYGGGSFTGLDAAVQKFLNEASKHAPNRETT